MRRDRVLIRAILEFLRGADSPWVGRRELRAVEAPRPDILDYHLSLCEQAGFVVVAREPGRDQRFQLTWTGHEERDQADG